MQGAQKTRPLNTTGFENGYLSRQDYNRLFSISRQDIGGENFDLRQCEAAVREEQDEHLGTGKGLRDWKRHYRKVGRERSGPQHQRSPEDCQSVRHHRGRTSQRQWRIRKETVALDYFIEYLFRHPDGSKEWLLCEFGTEHDGWTGKDRLSSYQKMSPNTQHRLRYV